MDGFLALKSLLQCEIRIHKKAQALFWVRLVVIKQTLMYEIWKTAMVLKTYAVADGRNAHMEYEKSP